MVTFIPPFQRRSGKAFTSSATLFLAARVLQKCPGILNLAIQTLSPGSDLKRETRQSRENQYDLFRIRAVRTLFTYKGLPANC
jgi:hypothetical protein